jgi:hypothetical protein
MKQVVILALLGSISAI